MTAFLFLLFVVSVLLASLILYLLLKWHPSHLALICALAGLLTSAVLYLIYQEPTSGIAVVLLVSSLLSVAITVHKNFRRVLGWIRGLRNQRS
jgi:hypothetical protein